MQNYDQFQPGFEQSAVTSDWKEVDMTETYAEANARDKKLARQISDSGGAGWHNRPWPESDTKHTESVKVHSIPLEASQTTTSPTSPVNKPANDTRPNCDRCGLMRAHSHDEPPLCLCGAHRCSEMTNEVFCPDIEAVDDASCCQGHSINHHHPQRHPQRRLSGLSSPPMLAYEEDRSAAAATDLTAIREQPSRPQAVEMPGTTKIPYFGTFAEMTKPEGEDEDGIEEEDWEDEEEERKDVTGPEEDNFPRWMDRSRAC